MKKLALASFVTIAFLALSCTFSSVISPTQMVNLPEAGQPVAQEKTQAALAQAFQYGATQTQAALVLTQASLLRTETALAQTLEAQATLMQGQEKTQTVLVQTQQAAAQTQASGATVTAHYLNTQAISLATSFALTATAQAAGVGTDFDGAYIYAWGQWKPQTYGITIQLKQNVKQEQFFLDVDGVTFKCQVIKQYPNRLYCSGPPLQGGRYTIQVYYLNWLNEKKVVFSQEYSFPAWTPTPVPTITPDRTRTPTPTP
jgi:hypothetical protein